MHEANVLEVCLVKDNSRNELFRAKVQKNVMHSDARKWTLTEPMHVVMTSLNFGVPRISAQCDVAQANALLCHKQPVRHLKQRL